MTAVLFVAALCLVPRGDRITAADVAQQAPAFSSVPDDRIVGYSPLPGLTRTFRAEELRQWLARHAAADALVEDVCFEWPMRTRTPDEIRSAMLISLPAGSDVAVGSVPAAALPEGALQFPRAGLSAGGVWSGFVEYAPGKRISVSVPVVLKVPFSRVVAAVALRAGDRITADRLRLETGVGPPPKEGTAARVEEVAGKSARRFIPAGSSVELNAIADPAAVSRGDALQVEIRSGNARLRFDGLAQAAAATGAVVPIRMRDTGRIIHARVTGEGRAVLDLEKP